MVTQRCSCVTSPVAAVSRARTRRRCHDRRCARRHLGLRRAPARHGWPRPDQPRHRRGRQPRLQRHREQRLQISPTTTGSQGKGRSTDRPGARPSRRSSGSLSPRGDRRSRVVLRGIVRPRRERRGWGRPNLCHSQAHRPASLAATAACGGSNSSTPHRRHVHTDARRAVPPRRSRSRYPARNRRCPQRRQASGGISVTCVRSSSGRVGPALREGRSSRAQGRVWQ
jgi:hypothetical protein